MQALKETLFYSNFRPGLEVEADDDRELLVQEQKSCRARARKFSSETNRRRRALEERRRQWDVQEQRLREKILQQRKQRVQDATERFQRAHLPLSQRRRPVSGKRAPNLEEALSHIHGTLHSPFLSSASAINRSCTPSPKPPGGSSGPRSLRAVSAAEAYAKLMQERSLSDFKSNQLLFFNQLQESEDQQQGCPQDPQDTPPSCSESLSSLDSLENEVPQQGHDNSPACSSSFLDPLEVKDFTRPRQPNHLCPSSDHGPPKSFLEEVLSQQGSPSSSSPSLSPREDGESADEDQNLWDLTQAAQQCNLTDQSEGYQKVDTQSTPSCQNVQAQQDLAACSGHMANCFDSTAPGNISRDRGIVVAHCKTCTVPSLTQEPKLQGKTLEEKYAKCPSETRAAQPAGGCRHRDSFFQASSSTAADLNTASSHFGNVALQPVESEGSSESCKKKPDSTALQRENKPESYEEKFKRAEASNLPDECSDRRVPSKSCKTAEEPDRTLTEGATSCPAPKCGDVRFLKGILKKNSKYVVGDTKFIYTSGHFVFPKQVAMSIRDSMELTRTKAREPESDKSMKKKLRWFDEVNDNEEECEERLKKDLSKQAPTKGKPSNPSQQPSVDHQQELHNSGYMNAPPGIPKTSAGPSSTRQAWADARPQEEPTEEPKPQRSGARVAGSHIPRRVRSARTVSGPVSSRARKGTVIRPQSASEAQRVVRTQGKAMVPRPPPRSEVLEANSAEPTIYITKAAYSNDCPNSKAENPDSQPVSQHHVLKIDEGAVLAPVPPSYAYAYETVSKGIYALCQPEAQMGSARRPLQCGENGICLDRTPTDEEISLLWHGVRSALASKEVGDPRSFLTHNGSLSALPQGRANLSHVTINGDSLLSGVKAVTRMGGFFLSPSNARTPVRRPTVESNMVKNRAYVDHGRVQAAAGGDRKQHFLYQATVPISLYSSKTDQTVHDEEVMNGEGQVAVDVSQLQRAGVVLQQQRGQAFGLSALSLEEQRLLQSLDRLNHRLQYVQDMTAGNTALKGIFALDSANNQSPQTSEVLGATQRRYQTGSAENRTRSHRRY
ncbi:LOW QUALITY PROTEIN: centrosomal protein of 126 kDa [Colossoma macropomum]|uniref:LOW QUALITY PROTEIN: centrosomal protein of 126 kDa n=1 Tax=Colossoma macropomum TaxID=42526 RepID=UPI0018653D2D|nr:LOW QUALITY PROTEIN: centrosomal protein of 126 kDa [Colossoma macropomum]